MKLLLYGDLHAANLYSFNIKKSEYKFSQYSRIDELYSTLAWIAKMTREAGIMMPINMGDTFHQALRFYVERYNTVYRGVGNIISGSLSKSGIIIKGNHDETDEVSAIETFENSAGAVVVNSTIKVKYVSEINSHLIFVPYIRDPEKTKEAFLALYEKYKNSKSSVYVFCHLDIKEAYEGLVSSTYQLNQYNTYNDLKLGIYNAVFSGHIHFKKIINKNFYYIGSTLNHNFGDKLYRKGVTIVNIDPNEFSVEYKENPFCPLFVKFNLEKSQLVKSNIKSVENELKKFPKTNVYARIYSLASEEGRKKTSDFVRDYSHLFTAHETKNVDSEEELEIHENIGIDHINVFDLIVEHGSKLLKSQGKKQQEIEQYIMRLKRICQLN